MSTLFPITLGLYISDSGNVTNDTISCVVISFSDVITKRM